MMWNDFVNGAYECIGGLLVWTNVLKIYKDKQVKGIYWHVTAFFTTWSVWNLYYYPSLDQWWSFAGGVVIFIGNLAWTVMAVYYSRK